MKKEEIKPGDILTTDDDIVAHVIKLVPSGVRCWINGNKDLIYNEQLHFWHRANPIKNNRIVSSYTFAVRFKQFLEWVPKEWWMSQPHYYEEYNYMKRIANQLIQYQIYTCTDENEIKYFKNLGLWPQ